MPRCCAANVRCPGLRGAPELPGCTCRALLRLPRLAALPAAVRWLRRCHRWALLDVRRPFQHHSPPALAKLPGAAYQPRR